ncbi:MAG: YabP/YqfC family sporulation protein [Bacilli bacterium]|nr:YabP/YqfC family sporulation protein [Bacilli bacterium]
MRNIKNYVRQVEFKIILKKNIIDIENYTDLGNISDKEIAVFNYNEKIIIRGYNLSISKLLNNELLITGKYNNIIFEGNNE